MPSVKPVTVVDGLVELVITAEPLITDQVPAPVVGVFAAKVAFGLEIQTV